MLNRPAINESLAILGNIKGHTPAPEIGDRLLPTLDVLQLARTPYATYGYPLMGTISAGAVAAENSHAWVSPHINFALECRRLIIRATVTAGFQILLLNTADQAAIGVTSFGRLQRLRQRQPGASSADFPEASPSVIDQGSAVGVIGTAIGRILVPANVDREIEFGDLGVTLFGAEPGSGGAIQGLGVACETVNLQFHLTFIGAEWPRP